MDILLQTYVVIILFQQCSSTSVLHILKSKGVYVPIRHLLAYIASDIRSKVFLSTKSMTVSGAVKTMASNKRQVSKVEICSSFCFADLELRHKQLFYVYFPNACQCQNQGTNIMGNLVYMDKMYTSAPICPYLADVPCTFGKICWSIKVPSMFSINITFLEFDVYCITPNFQNTANRKPFIWTQIYDNGTLLGHYCGKRPPWSVYTQSNNVLIEHYLLNRNDIIRVVYFIIDKYLIKTMRPNKKYDVRYDNNPLKVKIHYTYPDPFWGHPIFGPNVFLQISGVAIHHWHIAVEVGWHMYIKIVSI